MSAVFLISFLASCGQNNKERVIDAGRQLGEAQVTYLPDLPEDCRKQARSGVKSGDRMDVALTKTDLALTTQNRRGAACAQWYETLRDAMGSPETP